MTWTSRPLTASTNVLYLYFIFLSLHSISERGSQYYKTKISDSTKLGSKVGSTHYWLCDLGSIYLSTTCLHFLILKMGQKWQPTSFGFFEDSVKHVKSLAQCYSHLYTQCVLACITHFFLSFLYSFLMSPVMARITFLFVNIAYASFSFIFNPFLLCLFHEPPGLFKIWFYQPLFGFLNLVVFFF